MSWNVVLLEEVVNVAFPTPPEKTVLVDCAFAEDDCEAARDELSIDVLATEDVLGLPVVVALVRGLVEEAEEVEIGADVVVALPPFVTSPYEAGPLISEADTKRCVERARRSAKHLGPLSTDQEGIPVRCS